MTEGVFLRRNGGEGKRLFYEFLYPQHIVRRNAVKAAKRDQVPDRQLTLAAFVFAVLLLTGVQNERDLLLGVAVFDSQFLEPLTIIHKNLRFAIIQTVILLSPHYYNMLICPNATRNYVDKRVEIGTANDTKSQTACGILQSCMKNG